MGIVKDIILVTMPALLVLLAAFLSIKQSFKNEQDKRRNELALANSKTITPTRLQAYERLTLFLERISIESLIFRTNTSKVNFKLLQVSMLENIRSEYEHNLAQQIYVTPQAWEVIITAKTNTIKLINTSAEKLPPKASGSDLSQYLLELLMEMDKEPAKAALDFLKGEVARMM